MKPNGKRKRKNALKKWLKERLGKWEPKSKKTPASNSKISA
ncbi:hypothetical protein EV207_10835 [Scopulibacillus darangshiensis]|uniref:Uncharacterized protein n=1 Tax=Scopulibacillus darangshiensis TaxID=442528 RepID=A0A4R2P6G5_9BACL|nr:hypothetical protein [Scopulibacillus darangshiensis]TCP29744.1 hypothetical protein EV207_10835 [Scopulibacillus darangshiensis]